MYEFLALLALIALGLAGYFVVTGIEVTTVDREIYEDMERELEMLKQREELGRRLLESGSLRKEPKPTRRGWRKR